MLIVLSFVMFPNVTMATEKTPVYTTTKTEEVPPEIKAMVDRLNEIKNMDKSTLTREERKELRKEVRTIKKGISGKGFYLSTGAVIIIVLLILIL